MLRHHDAQRLACEPAYAVHLARNQQPSINPNSQFQLLILIPNPRLSTLNFQFSILNFQLSHTFPLFSIFNFQFLIFNSQFSTFPHLSPFFNFQFLIFNFLNFPTPSSQSPRGNTPVPADGFSVQGCRGCRRVSRCSEPGIG